jgi:UDP-N-acetylmuramoyl-tripeptide--D-alanyl-D-alanine ligase
MYDMLTLADILTGAGVHVDAERADLRAVAVNEVVIDSRQATPGDVFFAFPGERADGHNYVGNALRLGAVAAVVERDLDRATIERAVWLDARPGRMVEPLPQFEAGAPFVIRVENTMQALQKLSAYWRAKFDVRVIGITGSVGKTTTKEMVAQVLSTRYRVLKNEGNLNNEIGVPLTLLKLRPEHERAVIEMGMYARGEIALFASLARPVVGVVTMVAPVHLERLGTMDNIVLAKAELVQALPPDGTAILNDDDERVRGMASLTQARVLTYGLTPRADLWAGEIESYGLEGISFTLHFQDQALRVRVPLLGRHSVHTALRAAAVGLAEGLTWDEIVAGFEAPPTQLRLAVVEGPFGSLVLDDTYNASEESVIAALNLLAEINNGEHIAVLGDMLELGDAEQQAHRDVGCRAGLVAQKLVCVGPRAKWIAEEAAACDGRPSEVHHVMDNAAALEVLRRIVDKKSVILVKGSRGMKMEEIVAGLVELAGSGKPEND